jgi:hypothetical protein
MQNTNIENLIYDRHSYSPKQTTSHFLGEVARVEICVTPLISMLLNAIDAFETDLTVTPFNCAVYCSQYISFR